MTQKPTLVVPEGIHTSRDRFLFLTGGHHDVAAYMSGRRQPEPASIRDFYQNLAARSAWSHERSIDFSTWVFPDKLFALRRKVPELGDLASLYQSRYRAAPEHAPEQPVFYPIEALEDRDVCFSRGDTHYSHHGEIEVMARIYDHLEPGYGAAYRAEALSALTLKTKGSGDLGKKVDPPQREKLVHMAPLKAYSKASNRIVGNNGGIDLYESPDSETGQTLLIFGDSFFRSLLPHLTHRFRRIAFMRTPFFHYEIVRALAAEVIFCGMAERYLAQCSADTVRPHFLSYPLVTGKRLNPEPEFAPMFQRFFDREALL